MIKGEAENNSSKPRDLLENRHSDSLKNRQLTFSLGMLKKGDVDNNADDDDKVSTSGSGNLATEILSTEEFFLRTQPIYSSPLISAERCGGAENRWSVP
jgi:hypothetical protein